MGKARAALKETDAAKVAAAQVNSGSRDDARYELQKALRVRKEITAMHDGSEGKLKVEVAKEKAARVNAVQKMRVLKQKDKASLNDAKLVAKKEAREFQNVGLMEVKVQSEEKTAKAKVKELKHKDQ